MILPEVGRVYLIQEALGLYIGTVVEAEPFGIRLGADAVFARDLGTYTNYMTTGRVNECHAMPGIVLAFQFVRSFIPVPHPAPRPGGGGDR